MSETIRSEKTKKAFIQYLIDHPDERFWQAIRNFAKVNYVLIIEKDDLDGGETLETFYREEL